MKDEKIFDMDDMTHHGYYYSTLGVRVRTVILKLIFLLLCAKGEYLWFTFAFFPLTECMYELFTTCNDQYFLVEKIMYLNGTLLVK